MLFNIMWINYLQRASKNVPHHWSTQVRHTLKISCYNQRSWLHCTTLLLLGQYLHVVYERICKKSTEFIRWAFSMYTPLISHCIHKINRNVIGEHVKIIFYCNVSRSKCSLMPQSTLYFYISLCTKPPFIFHTWPLWNLRWNFNSEKQDFLNRILWWISNRFFL